ncbi:TIGR00288 family NYN domain-containing protein [Candidatus Micrarchaeota archaeon]|nr:TIGR00288 family NYN domain-containing protein [Candidatus Micrarchaeota archaeon]MBU1165823.1 TIGR00288 family NYN domain-containing protein [Candidatus Micrarchaeota archaeon]MBU1886827.1 TIGR00288 family NYN domain-containing protein [Candidatus Micrarchaeota archaeon]
MFFKGLFGKKGNDIAVLVDGPNILRKAFNIDLLQVKKELTKYGKIRIAKIYLDQYASDKLIEAMVNQGFETEITTGDVDVTMAIEAMEYVMDDNIGTIVLVTRDTDYRPVLVKAKARGKKTIIIATDVAFSSALRNTADKILIFRNHGRIETIDND